MNSKSNTSIEHWLGDLDSDKLATVLHEITEGNKKKLLSKNYTASDGIWGTACKQLFPEHDINDRDRHFLLQIWSGNRKRIQHKYDFLCGKPKLKGKCYPLRSSQSQDAKEKCFCEKVYRSDKKDMVECTLCGQWVHGVCAQVAVNEFKEDDVFECGICSGEFIVPNIFDATTSAHDESQPTSDIDNGREQSSPEDDPFVSPESKDQLQKQQPDAESEAYTEGSPEDDIPSDALSDDDDFEIRRTSTPKKNVKARRVQLPSDTEDLTVTEMQQVTKKFSFLLQPDVWKKCFSSDTLVGNLTAMPFLGLRAMKFQSCTEYTNIFYANFHEVNKGCVLSFQKKLLNNTVKWGKFFTSKAVCKNKPCTAKWNFVVPDKPKRDTALPVFVNLEGGEVNHGGDDVHMRRITGEQKIPVYDSLRDSRPSKEYVRRIENADPGSLKEGNFTEVGTRKALQVIRSKILTAKDRSKDVVHDILIQMEDHKKSYPDEELPGHIRSVGVHPCFIIMYGRQQLNVMKLLLQTAPEGLQLQFDATGAFLYPLGGLYDKADPLLYTIVTRDPFGHSPIPLYEVISTKGDVTTVHYCLLQFFERNICNVNEFAYGVRKLEVDFSKVMIAAAALLFNKCNADVYMNRLWDISTNNSNTAKEKIMCIHVCNFHLERCFKKKIKACFKSNFARENLTSWYTRLLQGRDMWSFTRSVQDIGVICGYKKFNNAVTTRLVELDEPTNRTGKESWRNFRFRHSNNPLSPFYLRSKYGEFASHLLDAAITHNELLMEQPNASTTEDNEFYSPDFVKYLRIHIFPYYAIISKSVFEAVGMTYVDAGTTNLIESYHSHIKRNIHHDSSRIKISRFIFDQTTFVKGTCKEVEALLLRKAKGRPLNKVNLNKTSDSEDTATADEGGTDVEEEPDWDAPKLLADERLKNEPSWDSPPRRTEEHSNDASKFSPRKSIEKFKKPLPRVRAASVVKLLDMPHVRWGGRLVIEDREIDLRNTCAIDAILGILCYMYKTKPYFIEFIRQESEELERNAIIHRCIQQLFISNFNEGKKIWISEVLRIQNMQADMLGTLRENGLDGINHWFPVDRKLICKNFACPNFGMGKKSHEFDNSIYKGISYNIFDIYGNTVDDVVLKINEEVEEVGNHCLCQSNYWVTYDLLFDLPFIVIAADGREKGTPDNMLAKEYMIKGEMYSVFGYTTFHFFEDAIITPHIKATVLYEGKRICVDSLMPSAKVETKFSNAPVTSVWLQKSELGKTTAM